ncbi:hypothetical protein BH23GEM6_BH23GEM6_11540 [soil metagenome]
MCAHFGITVASKPDAEQSSARLVEDFLYYSSDLQIEVAARIAGVSTATLGRWRMMGARQLRSDVRARLEHFLDAPEAERRRMSVA